MTKNEEIEMLRMFIAQLGPDSYLGPVLAAEFHDVESAIRSDFEPRGLMPRLTDKQREYIAHVGSIKEQTARLATLKEGIAVAEDRARALQSTLGCASKQLERVAEAAQAAARRAHESETALYQMRKSIGD